MHRDAEAGEPLELHLPVLPESVPIGRRAAAQYAEELGCSQQTLWRVRLAVSEALSNVVLHAHVRADPSQAILVVSAASTARRLVVTVADEGVGLRARADSPGMGLGLGLIAKSCDELEIGGGEAGGTVVRMTFLR